MTIRKLSNSYYIKKGLLLTVIRIRGIVETRRCGAVAVWSQVITWSSALTLYALYLSRPLPPPLPSHQLRPFFPKLGPYHHPVFTLTRGIQGCPKTISLDKNIRHPSFENLSKPPFFSAALHPYIFATPSAKKCSPFSTTQQSENLSGFFLSSQLFSLLLNECQLFMPKDFWNLPV